MSMSTAHRSGTTLGALPPEINAAFTVGEPTSGCVRSGSTSGSRSRNLAIEVIAFTPRCGWEPWAAVPWAVAVNQAPPRSARLTCSSLGSPTMAASWVSRPRSHSTFVPWTPASSSSAARWNTSRPALVVELPGPRIVPPGVERTGRHHVEVAVPGEARTRRGAERGHDARPSGLGTHDLGAGAEARQDVGRDGRRLVLGAARVLALGGDERTREVEHLVGLDRRRGGGEHTLIYHGARCYMPTRSTRSPRRSRP